MGHGPGISLSHISDGGRTTYRLPPVGSRHALVSGSSLAMGGGGDNTRWNSFKSSDSSSDAGVFLGYRYGNIGSCQLAYAASDAAASLLTLPLDELLANLRDAVTITARLGIKYLWIDCVCILQDSPQDWANEAANMTTVYGTSTLTIYTAASPDSNTGILRNNLNPPSRFDVLDFIVDPCKLSSVPVRVERSRGEDEATLRTLIERGPLASRFWTLQEYILSPRRLIYGDRQIYWNCLAGLRSADLGRLADCPLGGGTYHAPPRMSEPLGSLVYSNVLEPSCRRFEEFKILMGYYELVEQYTKRQLTVPSDTLPAFSGIAQRFCPVMGDDGYVAGLWTSDIIFGLCWRTSFGPGKRTEVYRAPSCSWASMEHGIETCFNIYNYARFRLATTSRHAASRIYELQLLEYKMSPRTEGDVF
ncbi:heterokaryon incompatibility protein-domain-containing protein [Podospora fimiseda]|uniref:Heterokaryon incompatibility protein-domain-containing protein n=1 Tax=Podospora fimiseda TaxID=252190 RepID=A0AAN6YN38_9PEZI|nr:heterokaryon incompatibility protein-domain-containing protein [Podospora fimiseda]